MTHIVAGYPTLEKCERLAVIMAESEASFLEIQIPFSDPVADGKTIAEANQHALNNGTSVQNCFALAQRLSKKIKIPILLMSYFNIPFRYGLEKFCRKARASGCYGLIIPDMPIDEEPYEHYRTLCKKYRLHSIEVISPLTTGKRLQKIAVHASGFVYCMARTGTTGERKNLGSTLIRYLQKVRKYITVPLAIGFGISKKSHVKNLSKKADIIVIGSKILNLYNQKGGSAIRSFLKEVVGCLHERTITPLQRPVRTVHSRRNGKRSGKTSF